MQPILRWGVIVAAAVLTASLSSENLKAFLERTADAAPLQIGLGEDRENLLQLLKSLQRQRRHMAMVLDEFGGTAGMVTMGDILEEMVGKIRRETDVEGFLMENLGTGRWRVSGTMRLDDFRREYPPLGDVPEVETMGGLLMSLLDVVPSTGDSVVFRGLKLTAQVADERRVREVLVEKTK